MAAADTGDGPTFVLTEPNTQQPAMYRVTRRRGLLRNEVNVISASKKTTSRSGPPNTPSTGARAITRRAAADRGHLPRQRDARVLRLTRGQKRKTARVDSVQSIAEAKNLAWRMRADDRRDGYNITYTVSGHTIPALNGRTANDRAVWCVDTVVDVVDDEYGIYGPMYLEEVQFQRDGGGTRTTLSLIDPADWVPPL